MERGTWNIEPHPNFNKRRRRAPVGRADAEHGATEDALGAQFGLELLLLFEVLEHLDGRVGLAHGVLGRVHGPHKLQRRAVGLVAQRHRRVDDVPARVPRHQRIPYPPFPRSLSPFSRLRRAHTKKELVCRTFDGNQTKVGPLWLLFCMGYHNLVGRIVFTPIKMKFVCHGTSHFPFRFDWWKPAKPTLDQRLEMKQ